MGFHNGCVDKWSGALKVLFISFVIHAGLMRSGWLDLAWAVLFLLQLFVTRFISLVYPKPFSVPQLLPPSNILSQSNAVPFAGSHVISDPSFCTALIFTEQKSHATVGIVPVCPCVLRTDCLVPLFWPQAEQDSSCNLSLCAHHPHPWRCYSPKKFFVISA